MCSGVPGSGSSMIEIAPHLRIRGFPQIPGFPLEALHIFPIFFVFFVTHEGEQSQSDDYTTTSTPGAALCQRIKHVFKLADDDPCIRAGCVGASSGCFRLQLANAFPNVSVHHSSVQQLRCLFVWDDTDDIIRHLTQRRYNHQPTLVPLV